MSTYPITVLLVSWNLTDTWLKRFQVFLTEFKKVDPVDKARAVERFREYNYDIVVLDENCLIGDYPLIKQFTEIQPATRVIVIADSPDWRKARQAFQSGAVEYVPTSIDGDEMKKILQEV